MENKANNSVGDERFLSGRVTVVVDDITSQDVIAIVNAANSTLLGGGGVDGAIHRVGGPEILSACRKIRETTHPMGLPPGDAVITPGGNLRAKYVIHTVGPIYGRDKDKESVLLANCYRNSLRLAVEHSINSIAIPSISTGAFGYPRNEAAAIASAAIRDFLAVNSFPMEVRLVFFQQSDARMFLNHQEFE